MKLLRWLQRLPVFVVLGLLFATPGEVLNQLLARRDPVAFRHTLVSYAVLLVLGYGVGGLLRLAVKSAAVSSLVFYLLFGTLGLMVEWFLLGNAPVLDVFQVIVQPGMFTYWGTMMLGPRLVMEPAGAPGLRQAYLLYFAASSALYLAVASSLPRERGGIFLGFVIFAAGTAGLNGFYAAYLRRLIGTGLVNSPAPDGAVRVA
jgi:hypothetical protein